MGAGLAPCAVLVAASTLALPPLSRPSGGRARDARAEIEIPPSLDAERPRPDPSAIAGVVGSPRPALRPLWVASLTGGGASAVVCRGIAPSDRRRLRRLRGHGASGRAARAEAAGRTRDLPGGVRRASTTARRLRGDKRVVSLREPSSTRRRTRCSLREPRARRGTAPRASSSRGDLRLLPRQRSAREVRGGWKHEFDRRWDASSRTAQHLGDAERRDDLGVPRCVREVGDPRVDGREGGAACRRRGGRSSPASF